MRSHLTHVTIRLGMPAVAAVCLVATASARVEGAAAQGASRPPNIIYIMADDLGYGDLGCYGQKQIRTPHIDRMAEQGMRFTQAYAGSTVCAPSRCCLMTGFHTGRARIRGNAPVPLQPEDVTVAEVLKQAGYVTGIVGKWGLGEPETTGVPNQQGFDTWFGYLNQRNAHNYYPYYLWRNQTPIALTHNLPGDEVADPLGLFTHEVVKLQSQHDSREQYSHNLMTREALGFVRRHHAKPFFLYLAYTLPHANNERGRVEKDGMETPDYGQYKDKDWPNPQKGHAAMISHLDRDVGKLMALLVELGIDGDTIVFFTSDNGPHREGGAKPDFFDSNGPLKGIKRDLYEGGIRVPMIVRWPGKVRAGSTNDHIWAFWDFLPTAAELAGAKAPDGIDGISVVPTLLGQDDRQKQHAYLYWEFHEGPSKQAIRMGQWKAVRRAPSRKTELYDVTEDIGEENDLAGSHPELVAKAERIFKHARTESERWKIRDVTRKKGRKK